MLQGVNFKVFKKLLIKNNLKSIIIEINSSVINVEGHQEAALKGYSPKKVGNRCYNNQFTFCDELNVYITRFTRNRNTYTSNGDL